MDQAAIEDANVLDGLSIRYLKLLGLWRVINDYRTTGKRNAIIKFQLALTFFMEFPYVLSQYLSYILIEIDVQKATCFLLHTLPGLQAVARNLMFWFRIDSQCRLNNLIRKDFLAIPESKRAEAEKIFRKVTRKSNLLCMAAFLVNASTAVLAIADPGISAEYIAHKTDRAKVLTGRKKVLCAWYPLPIEESPYYDIIYVYESMLITFGALFLGVYVCMYYQILMCLYAQFMVLGLHISTVKIHTDERGSSKNDQVYKELKTILKDHQKLLRYSDELRSVYNPLVTMILGMGIFLLITAVFQFLFGKITNPMYILKTLQYLTYQAIEVTMFCFGSSYIQEASSELQFAVYSSEWYKADLRFRQAAQILMVRTRRAETLTAIRMYPVNMETVVSILQFAYSVSTLLSRISE